MFNKRRIERNLEDRILNIQYRNRQAVRGAEQQVLGVVGIIFTITILIGYIGTWATNMTIIEPVHAQEIEIIETVDVPEIVKATKDDLLIQSVNVHPIPIKVGASDFQNEMIEYAYKISGKDFDFIKLIEAESGWVIDAVGVNNDGSKDFGLCQISSYWHKQIVNDPKFNNWKWEIDTCYQMYDGGVTFYGIKNINKPSLVDNFKWITK